MQLDKQAAENASLREADTSRDRETKTLRDQNDDMRKQLDSSRKALRDIRAAAARTTDRIRKHHEKRADGQNHHA